MSMFQDFVQFGQWRSSGAAGACIYLSMVVVQTWNASVHRTWQHYARKERERAELMDFIRQVGIGDHGSSMDQTYISKMDSEKELQTC